MTTYNCTQCIRPMNGPPFFRNAKGWLVCLDCLLKGRQPQDVTAVNYETEQEAGVVVPERDGAVGG